MDDGGCDETESPSSSSAQPSHSRRSFISGAVATALVATTGCSTGSGPRAARPKQSAPSLSRTSGSTEAHAATTLRRGATTAEFVARGPDGSGHVALTFHTNGNVGLAHQLLDLVDARNVRVTAFIVGNWLDQHPDWARRLVDNGHELANHTYSHKTFARLAPGEMADEIVRCRDALSRAGGSGGRFFRPSGTANGTDIPLATVLAAAGAAGYRTVLGYDVDPADYQDPGPAIVAQRTISALHPGAVVSLHFGHPGTIRALPMIFDAMSRRGLSAVTASELIGS